MASQPFEREDDEHLLEWANVDAEVAPLTSSLPAAWSDHHPTPPAFVDALGTSEERWIPALEHLPAWSPPGDGGHVVVVSPHPDDETLGVGGLMAELLARRWSVCVVAVTDGEAAHGRQVPSAARRLARRRRAEQEAALGRLRDTGPRAGSRSSASGCPMEGSRPSTLM